MSENEQRAERKSERTYAVDEEEDNGQEVQHIQDGEQDNIQLKKNEKKEK